MHYRAFGRSGIEVSLLSLGTGGASQFGQKTGLDDAGRKELVRTALESGINLFDTSEQYGNAEELLGRALQGVPRENYVLATKWGYKTGGEFKDPSELRKSTDRSLQLLKTDVIDVMQFHGILPGHYDGVVERFIPEMLKLRDEGKVRLIGFTQMMTQDPKAEVQLEALQKHPDLWDSLMLKYGILNQWPAKEVLPLAEKHGVAIMNMAPVRQTLTREEDRKKLFERWRAEGPVDVSSLDADDPFSWLVHGDVESVIDVGYRFAGIHSGITSVITGTANVDHIEDNVRSINALSLPGDDYRRLVEVFGDSEAPN